MSDIRAMVEQAAHFAIASYKDQEWGLPTAPRTLTSFVVDAIERVARQAVEAEREAFVKQGINKAIAVIECYDFHSSDMAIETSLKHAKRMIIRTIQHEAKNL